MEDWPSPDVAVKNLVVEEEDCETRESKRVFRVLE